MKPETRSFLEKATRLLDRAQRMISLDLPEDAARTAYVACFHLAQAIIFEKTGKIAKTHKGVQAEFYMLTSEQDHDDVQGLLARFYKYKYLADYATVFEEETSLQEATVAVASASRFFSLFVAKLS